MSSATVSIFISWVRQNPIRSGTRAMVPSSFMISQMIPAGIMPASLARSTDASVWPARTSTPPLRARSGNMWPRRRIDCYFDGMRTIMRRDSRGHAVARVNRLAESGPVLRGVLAGHGTDAQVFEPFFGHGQANEAASVLGHEVNGFGSDLFRGEGEIAFVLAILVVNHDDHAADADLFDRGGDVGKG